MIMVRNIERTNFFHYSIHFLILFLFLIFFFFIFQVGVALIELFKRSHRIFHFDIFSFLSQPQTLEVQFLFRRSNKFSVRSLKRMINRQLFSILASGSERLNAELFSENYLELNRKLFSSPAALKSPRQRIFEL